MASRAASWQDAAVFPKYGRCLGIPLAMEPRMRVILVHIRDPQFYAIQEGRRGKTGNPCRSWAFRPSVSCA